MWGASVSTQSVSGQAAASSGQTSLVPVAGRAMRVRTSRLSDRRPGEPVVILEGGALQPVETWNTIFDRVAAVAPVIAYDRRGIGGSEFDSEPQTLAHVTHSLHALLAAMAVPPPYVLVGHSYGGVLVRAFARTYPGEVAGLVFLDGPDADLTIADLKAVSPDALRVLQSELDGLPSDLPAGMRAELDNIKRLRGGDFTDLRATRPPANIPTAVLIAAGKIDQVTDPAERSIRAGILQLNIRHGQDWALSSRKGLFVVTQRGGHYIHQDNPELSLDAIRHIVAVAVANSKAGAEVLK
jgi:pimeloyl-ACP methyl ester carboxylesterase